MNDLSVSFRISSVDMQRDSINVAHFLGCFGGFRQHLLRNTIEHLVIPNWYKNKWRSLLKL